MNLNIAGPEDGRPVVMSNALGTTQELWNPQMRALTERFRVIRYDHPPRSTVNQLAEDLLDALDRLGLERVSFCGLSLGAMVGMSIGADAPDHIDRLVLACTSARFGEPEEWRQRAATVRAHGMQSAANDAIEKWFTPAYSEREPFLTMQLQFAPEHYALGLEAIGSFDFRDRLDQIEAPTLVIAGAEDTATTPADAAALRDGIPGAELIILPNAAHLANVEQAAAFTTGLVRHFSDQYIRP